MTGTTVSAVELNLSPEQQRVLGALIEKRMTTPDHFPLSTNALIAACNQSSSRDPVVTYDESTVVDAVNALRDSDLARTVKRSGERAIKHLDQIETGLDIDSAQAALLAVLLLRGAQTPGELRTRTARYHDFELDDVEATLAAMQSADIPTVRLLGRRPGEREARWQHLLGERADDQPGEPEAPDLAPRGPSSTSGRDLPAELDDLKTQVAALRSDFDALRSQLGGG